MPARPTVRVASAAGNAARALDLGGRGARSIAMGRSGCSRVAVAAGEGIVAAAIVISRAAALSVAIAEARGGKLEAGSWKLTHASRARRSEATDWPAVVRSYSAM